MQTTATKSADGKSYVLSGQKMWITNGTTDGVSTGDAFLVYARTGPKRGDVSSFLVEKNAPGFTLGQKVADKCGMRASPTAELVFDQVAVDARDALVGEENKAALCMMRNLEVRGGLGGGDTAPWGLLRRDPSLKGERHHPTVLSCHGVVESYCR
mmetsp:Transcript_55184/g.125465  ORF Transcript_55184/g.125465 Transcript_55184/m.125465 type:complete len:155 (-) Transcript_55184:871-1335(-)